MPTTTYVLATWPTIPHALAHGPLTILVFKDHIIQTFTVLHHSNQGYKNTLMIKYTLEASYLDLNISESHFSYQLLRGSVTKKMQRFEEVERKKTISISEYLSGRGGAQFFQNVRITNNFLTSS